SECRQQHDQASGWPRFALVADAGEAINRVLKDIESMAQLRSKPLQRRPSPPICERRLALHRALISPVSDDTKNPLQSIKCDSRDNGGVHEHTEILLKPFESRLPEGVGIPARMTCLQEKLLRSGIVALLVSRLRQA